MEWFYNKKRGMAAFLLAVLALTFVYAGGEETAPPPGENPALTAWWGTLYPKFCFAQGEPGRKVKISFRLAELLDW